MIERYFVSEGDEGWRIEEPEFNKSDRFWEWEYWAVKEHMAMTRCESLLEYLRGVLMMTDMPNRRNTTEPEIDDRPSKGDPMSRVFIFRVPLKQWEGVKNRHINLMRSWREFVLYPALQEGLIEAHYEEIKGEEWPLAKE